MRNSLFKNYLQIVGLLAINVIVGQAHGGWADISSQNNYNKRFGDFPPLDIDQQLQDSMNKMEAEAERSKTSMQATKQTRAPSSKQAATKATSPAANTQRSGKVPGQAYQTNVFPQQGYATQVYPQSNGAADVTGVTALPGDAGLQNKPGGPKIKHKGAKKKKHNSGIDFPWGNNGSGFNVPWNNRRSSFSAPWNNRGSGFNAPWDNNNSSFSFPWNNNDNNNFSFGPWGNNRRHR